MDMIKKCKKSVYIFALIFVVVGFLLLFRGYSMAVPIDELSEERQAVYDKMKIDYVNVNSRTTGTAPFNTGTSDANGNDVSETDDYVRTFDVMRYMVEIGISPNTSHGDVDLSELRGGVIKVKATLPNQGDQTIMSWQADAWMKNVQYSDNNRTIYAEYHVPNTTNVTNANQNLSFTIKVDGYKKEVTDNMKPTFEIWMEGNKPDNEDSDVDSVTIKDNKNIIISGHESFDVVVANGGYLNIKGEREINGVQTPGQYINYGVGVALYQDNASFSDLRGICYPSTEEFDVNLKMQYGYRLATSNNWSVITEGNPKASNLVNGTQVIEWGLNRENKPNYFPDSDYVRGTASLPAGRLGNPYNSVQNSGNMTLVQDNENITMTFKNYTLNGTFPDRGWKHATAQSAFAPYGFFAVGNFELFIPYYDVNGGDYVYQFAVQADSASTKSTSGEIIQIPKGSATINDNVSSNNRASVIVNSNLTGSSWGIIRAYNSDGSSSLDDLYNYGNGASIIGKDFTISAPHRMYDGPYDGGVDALIAWNAKLFQLEKMSDNDIIEFINNTVNGYPCSSTDNIKYYFGIYKANPSQGITDNTTVNGALHDDFDWYESLTEAKSKGKITAIFVDDPDLEGFTTEREFRLRFTTVNSLENVGKVGIFRFKWRFYADEERTKVYYYGGQEKYESNNGYTPTVYNPDGTVEYEASEEFGESILVLSEKANIIVGTTDKDANNNVKKSYDVRDGVINVRVVPSLTNENTPTDSDPYSEKVTVKTILPNGLTYRQGSANVAPSSVVTNSDGSTTLTWEYTHWQVNHSAPGHGAITFKADISAALQNNNKLQIKSTIKSDGDSRDEAMFRTSVYEVNISNLSGSMTLKEIDKTIIDINDTFNIRSTIGNNGQETLRNIKTIEILPKNNDSNGSHFTGTYTTKITNSTTGLRFFYTTNSIDSIGITQDEYGKDTIRTVDLENDSRWIEVNVGGTIPSDATAMATYLPELESNTYAKYVTKISLSGNDAYDKYVFNLNMTSDNLSAAVKSNFVIAQGANRKISGMYFIDINRNDMYDTDDVLYDNRTVKLLNSSGTVVAETQTDSNGMYTFDKLTNDNYIVQFENMGNDFEVIGKGAENNSSKANSNYKSDVLDQTVQPTMADYSIENINIGVRKKAAQVITNHIYQDTDEVFKVETQDKYFGDTYITSQTNDLLSNYTYASVTGTAQGTVNSSEIIVNYYYKKKDSKINLNLAATGTKKITSKDEEVSYRIIGAVGIEDYIGNGSIVLTSKLPYPIDVNNSNLDGGTYNLETNSIVWTVSGPVNTYENSNSSYNIEKNIKVIYENVKSTDRNLNNAIDVKVQLDNNQSTATASVNTNVEIKGKIKVHYYEMDENGETKEISTADELVGLIGSDVEISPKNIKGYVIDEEPSVIDYIYSDDEQTVSFIYKRQRYNINVKTLNDGGTVTNSTQIITYGEDSDEIVIKTIEDYCIDTISINGKKMTLDQCENVHKLKLTEVTQSMDIEVSFYKKPDNPITGDNIIKFIVLAISSFITLVCISTIKKSFKHEA